MPHDLNATAARGAEGARREPTESGIATVQMVPVDALRPAFSPRSEGEDEAHIRLLAESEADLPPILVHRPTMQVIDGMHRLCAARMRDRPAIPVQFFDGSESEAFVLAVRSNTTHGLPLSVADRRQAASRILASHAHWSDRAVAEVAGLSAKSVAALRSSLLAESGLRTGRDGRARPLSTAEARRRAGRLLAANPAASLREIAEKAGISPGTVRDVRRRIEGGEDPVPLRQRVAGGAGGAGDEQRVAGTGQGVGDGASPDELSGLLVGLGRDPALRYNDSGRLLLRLLSGHVLLGRRLLQLAGAVPVHCRPAVARAARACARLWVALADRLTEGSLPLG